MKKKFGLAIVAIACLSLLLVTSKAYTMPILNGSSTDGFTWEASDSEGRSAEAVFSYSDDMVTIQLTNTTSSLVSVPNQGLAGLFFDFDGALSKPSVSLGSSTLILAPEDDGQRVDGGDSSIDGDLDGEFGYLTGINGINGGLGDYGVSNTAFDPEPGAAPAGWVGFGGTIINENVAYPNINTPNGPGFLIVGEPGAAAPMASFSYIMYEVFITFDYVGPFNANSVGQVNFLYGTEYSTPVPEPATMLLFGTGLVGLASARGRRKKK